MIKRRYVCIILSVFTVLFISSILYEKWTRVTFVEDNHISMFTTFAGNTIGISGVLCTSEELREYLSPNYFVGHEQFSGYIEVDSLDFTNYDYLVVEGRPIIRLVRQLWDDCSSYDETGLIPIEARFGTNNSQRVYFYKISPKNRYRYVCP